MQHIVELPAGKRLKLYFNQKVYSPKYSAIDTVILAHDLVQGAAIKAHDVACGSGVIGLGLAKLDPQITLSMSDNSPESVKLARLNAKRNGVPARIFLANLLEGVSPVDMIVANLPTFTEAQIATQTLHGPKSAYLGAGLDLYTQLFKSAQKACRVLVCECQELLQPEFLELARVNNWKLMARTDMAFGFMVG